MSLLNKKIVIIGAGIVGASVAYHLAKRNEDVTVIERHPAAAREVTEKSFAWINTTHWVAPEYWRLYDAALEEYHALQQELSELKIHWHGALTWGTPPPREKPLSQKLNREQLKALEPNLKEYPDEAMFVSEEGYRSNGAVVGQGAGVRSKDSVRYQRYSAATRKFQPGRRPHVQGFSGVGCRGIVRRHRRTRTLQPVRLSRFNYHLRDVRSNRV
ncbi:FAD-dependent oxidoreductase [Cohnella sp. LGH]|uniref:FAD-dependent oxidoreductase n=1 Tax=Cohnella sp. LGH TaxID=1619153 RepID=UPI001FFE22EA|nr:FAD-dependent oxidoreductase [Cohnella sp. LGH]